MHLFTTFLILATVAAAPSGAGDPPADVVFRCQFDAQIDRDYDGWPDAWTRRRGREYPDFVRIGIVPLPPAFTAPAAAAPTVAEARVPTAEQCLAISLDGGAGQLTSPRIAIDSGYSVIFQALVRTDRIKHDAAHLTLTTFDDAGNAIETHDSPAVRGTSDWTQVQVGPIAVEPHAKTAAVSLTLAPRGGQEDLSGTAWFSDLRLLRVPRMTLRTNQPLGICHDRQSAEVCCEVSGIVGADPEVIFELYDHTDMLLASQTAKIVAGETKPRAASGATDKTAIAGAARWKPPLPGYGFYRIRVKLPLAGESVFERIATLAVLRPVAKQVRGEFGWSLPAGDDPLTLEQLAELLGESGVHWAKFPVWHHAPDDAWTDRLAWFAERLSLRGVEMVGLLDRPPLAKGETGDRTPMPIATLFADASPWSDAVDPVMTRLSLKVRWWQLGADDDVSFVGVPNVDVQLAKIKQQFDRFRQDIRLGIAWRWTTPPPASPNTPWEFLSLTSDPPLTADELARYLRDGAKPQPIDAPVGRQRARLARTHFANGSLDTPITQVSAIAKPLRSADLQWVTLPPLARKHYSTSVRVRDLVQRMIAAKVNGADGVFIPEPFSNEHGVMQPDGTPSDLFVPWRTIATALSGAKHLGELQLPGASRTSVFGRDGQAVVLIWNEQTTRERLSLGGEVQAIDLWGRDVPLHATEADGIAEISVDVGPTPILLIGVNEAVARCQTGLTFENDRLASIFGKEQTLVLRLPNPFTQSVSGQMTLRTPKSINVNPRVVQFKIAAGDELRQTLPVLLDVDASSGPQAVAIDLEVAADKPYLFRVHRTLQLGLEGLTIEMSTRLLNGSLVVEQRLTNQTAQPISFRCTLFPPGRRRETRQVLELGPEQSTAVFVLPDGESLVGQTLRLRAEEIGGDRVLNQMVTAER